MGIDEAHNRYLDYFSYSHVLMMFSQLKFGLIVGLHSFHNFILINTLKAIL